MTGPVAVAAGGAPWTPFLWFPNGRPLVRTLRLAVFVMDMCCAGIPLVPGSVAYTWAGFLAFFLVFFWRWHGATSGSAFAHGVLCRTPHMWCIRPFRNVLALFDTPLDGW